MDLKARLHSKAMWLSIAALVTDVLIFSGVITLPISDQIQSFIQRGLEILVGLGLLNDPTTSHGGFGDEGTLGE